MSNNKKNILILGGLGFIGNNLIEEFLRTEKYNIIVFNKKSKRPDDQMAKGIKIYYGEFNDITGLEKIFMENKIDIVFHLISSTIPANSNENIAYDINSNLIPTVSLFELIYKYKIKKIVFFSSGGTIYGLNNKNYLTPFSEESPTYPICSHGIVKLAIEKYLYMYSHIRGIEYLILRISNPYGEFHTSDRQGLINVFLEKIINNEPVTVWGNGETIRDYIYIKDVAKIIRQLIDKNISNQIINIGSGEGHSINQILALLKETVGEFEIERKEGRNFDVPCSVLNTEKLNSLININITPIQDGIKKTYEWLKSK